MIHCAAAKKKELFEMFAVVDPDQDDDVKSKFAFVPRLSFLDDEWLPCWLLKWS